MRGLKRLPGWANLLVTGSLLAYIGVVLYSLFSPDPLVELTADVFFGIIALGIGAAIYWAAEETADPLRAAGVSFLSGGVAQIAGLAVGEPLLEALATLGVFCGVLLYVYAIRSTGR